MISGSISRRLQSDLAVSHCADHPLNPHLKLDRHKAPSPDQDTTPPCSAIMGHMDDPVTAFLIEARGYCTLMADNTVTNSWVFARDCLRSILRLYTTALLLPAREPLTIGSLNRIDAGSWQLTRERIGRKLARESYWEIFEPLEQEQPESLCGSLSDDLADIWRDVKEGIVAIDMGGETLIDEAVWHWRSSLESHWGHHAVGAIGALHALCFGPFADTSRPVDELRCR